MLSLESEQKDAELRLALEKRMLPTITREHVLAWLEHFRTRKVDDPALKKEIFSTFLEAAYLYDERLRLVFNYTGTPSKGEYQIQDILNEYTTR